VRDLPALRERLRQHGIEPKLDYSYKGHWRIYVIDPWNNRTEFIEKLPDGVTSGMTDSEAAAILGNGTDAKTS
jgi:hypothetical protein